MDRLLFVESQLAKMNSQQTVSYDEMDAVDKLYQTIRREMIAMTRHSFTKSNPTLNAEINHISRVIKDRLDVHFHRTWDLFRSLIKS
jgi:hypothetical protein